MKKIILNRNLIIAVSVVSSILFFMFWFEPSYAIKNDNDLQGEDFGYIFDPEEYIGDEGDVQQEKNANANNLNNKGNLVQHQPNEPQEMNSDSNDTNMIKKNKY